MSLIEKIVLLYRRDSTKHIRLIWNASLLYHLLRDTLNKETVNECDKSLDLSTESWKIRLELKEDNGSNDGPWLRLIYLHKQPT